MKAGTGAVMGAMVLLASVCFTGGAGATDITNKLGNDDGAVFKVTDNSGNQILKIEADATSANITAGYSGNSVSAGLYGSVISGGGFVDGSSYPNTITEDIATISGGAYNRANGRASTVGGGWNNVAGETSEVCATVSGGHSNTALGEYGTVSGGYINMASGTYSAIGGGADNSAPNNHTTVGGGESNSALSGWSTVSGGFNNKTNEFCGTVGGGKNNYAKGENSTVSGGSSNTAYGDESNVGGGEYNYAQAGGSTVSGGKYNTASGGVSTVAGGYQNTASGEFSFAAGRRAKADAAGSFVWGDSTDADVTASATANRFVARATGGVYFYTDAGLTTGSYLAASGNSWAGVSDRNLKTGFKAVDPVTILEKLAGIPILEYSLKSQDPSIRHIGPMAQDFNGAFGYGESPRHIHTLDAEGITMAAVQGLYALLQEKEAVIKTLQGEIDALKSLQNEMDALKAQVSQFRQAALDQAVHNAGLEARLDRLEQTLAPRMARIDLEVR